MALEAWDGAWVPYHRVWDGFAQGGGHNSWVGRSLGQGQSSGLIERADETLTANREPGWCHDLRHELAIRTGLTVDQAWDWLLSYRITEKGLRQLAYARRQNPEWKQTT